MERKIWEKVSWATEMENSMTYVLNRYFVMGDFTVGTMFTQPLAGNELLRRLRFPVSLDEMWKYYRAWTTFRTLAIIDLTWAQPITKLLNSLT
jgi:hypothetical protein